jgi:hypothetical protein
MKRARKPDKNDQPLSVDVAGEKKAEKRKDGMHWQAVAVEYDAVYMLERTRRLLSRALGRACAEGLAVEIEKELRAYSALANFWGRPAPSKVEERLHNLSSRVRRIFEGDGVYDLRKLCREELPDVMRFLKTGQIIEQLSELLTALPDQVEADRRKYEEVTGQGGKTLDHHRIDLFRELDRIFIAYVDGGSSRTLSKTKAAYFDACFRALGEHLTRDQIREKYRRAINL